jgi:hypothetical protein
MIDTPRKAADMNSELEVGARPVDGQRATESPPSSEGPIPQPTVASAPAPQQKETDDKSSGRSEPDDSVAKPFYQGFKAGDTDPLVDVVIKEILVKTDAYIVYIDRDLVLHWHWNETVDSNRAAPILNRASELQAKSEFLRQTLRNRDLISARRLIGEGLVVMFSTQDQTYANAALDTAEKFITQIGTETSRGWYFVPFFIFFAVSAVIGLILYRHGQMRGDGSVHFDGHWQRTHSMRTKRRAFPSPSRSFTSVYDRLRCGALRLAGGVRQHCRRISKSRQ